MLSISNISVCFWLLLEFTAFILSLFGNSIVIFVMLTSRRIFTKSRYYIISVAISDLLIGILSISFAVLRAIRIKNPSFHVGELICRFLTTSMLILLSSLILQLVTVSFDRYWAICHPISYRNKSNNCAKVGIVSCWLIGSCVGLLPFLTQNAAGCQFYEISKKMEINYFQTLTLVIVAAAVAIVLLYGCIYHGLRNQVTKHSFSIETFSLKFCDHSFRKFE